MTCGAFLRLVTLCCSPGPEPGRGAACLPDSLPRHSSCLASALLQHLGVSTLTLAAGLQAALDRHPDPTGCCAGVLEQGCEGCRVSPGGRWAGAPPRSPPAPAALATLRLGSSEPGRGFLTPKHPFLLSGVRCVGSFLGAVVDSGLPPPAASSAERAGREAGVRPLQVRLTHLPPEQLPGLLVTSRQGPCVLPGQLSLAKHRNKLPSLAEVPVPSGQGGGVKSRGSGAGGLCQIWTLSRPCLRFLLCKVGTSGFKRVNTGRSSEHSGRPQEWSWGTEAQELGFQAVSSCLSSPAHVHGAPGPARSREAERSPWHPARDGAGPLASGGRRGEGLSPLWEGLLLPPLSPGWCGVGTSGLRRQFLSLHQRLSLQNPPHPRPTFHSCLSHHCRVYPECSSLGPKLVSLSGTLVFLSEIQRGYPMEW